MAAISSRSATYLISLVVLVAERAEAFLELARRPVDKRLVGDVAVLIQYALAPAGRSSSVRTS